MLRRLYTDLAVAENSLLGRCLEAVPRGTRIDNLRRRIVRDVPASRIVNDMSQLLGLGARASQGCWAMRQRDQDDTDIAYAQYFVGGRALRRQFGSSTKIVSDVFIMPSTHRIVNEEVRRFPEWGEPAIPPEKTELYEAHSTAMFDLSDALFCPAQAVIDDIARYDPALLGKCRLVRYGSSITFDRPAAPVPKRVLFAGSVQLRKGPQYLKQAVDLLWMVDPEIEFIIAGHASEQAARMMAGPNVRLLGHLSRDALVDEFLRADIFAFPSLAEGSAGVVMEAMAAGLPIVATRSAGVDFADGESGILVNERDVAGLADAILRIVRDRDLREAMSVEARRWISLYNEQRWADAFVSALVAVHHAA